MLAQKRGLQEHQLMGGFLKKQVKHAIYKRQHAHHVYSQQTRRTICIADCVEGLGVKKLVWQLANKVIQSLC